MQGIKANMTMLHKAITSKEPITGTQSKPYPKLFFALAFLHSVLVMQGQLETSVYNYRLSDFLVRRSATTGQNENIFVASWLSGPG